MLNLCKKILKGEKMKNNKKGYILLETMIFIIIISALCISIGIVITNKISINNKERVTQNLYLTAKSTITTFEEYFLVNKQLLEECAKNEVSEDFFIQGRDDIKNINIKFFYINDIEALIQVTVLDNLNNELDLSAKIPY